MAALRLKHRNCCHHCSAGHKITYWLVLMADWV